MKVLVGLGNPGEKYKYNRHNVGFSVVDKIAANYSTTTWVKKFHGKFCQCWSEGKKFLLLKPETFMNNSGQAVAAIITFYKLSISDLIVLHDDLDLKVGQVKVKHKGGHAGHNGIRSIHHYIGDNYTRIRIGVGHPGKKEEVSSYVLSDFTKSDNILIEAFIKDCVSSVDELISDNYANLSMSTIEKTLTPLQTKGKKSEISNSHSPSIHSSPKVSPSENSINVLKNIIKKLT